MRTIREDELRAGVFIRRLARVLGYSEATLVERGVPGEYVLLGDERIGMAIAGQIHEAQIGVLPVDVGQAGERHVALPAVVTVTLVKAGRGAAEIDHINFAIACQIHELVAAAGTQCHRG